MYRSEYLDVQGQSMHTLVFEPEGAGPHPGLVIAQHLPVAHACYGGRVKVAFADGGTPPIELAERIACPVMGVFGNDDKGPSPEDVDDYEAALTKAGVTSEFHRYDGGARQGSCRLR
jgi:dienelactone hydrolase